ncbi:hypothetical protein JQ554_15340 [Bradyrhizobium diazoefficiens]|nr:hypothetical protein [Bradyrhizobium diazoefficiens]MBR0965666.1 hypothetical protein [Bradyrhizobium diazoefficiens]MBR0979358.1 hypothetical protein [Bradyrhizobium diazoefficiens]MBR1008550.1 hypothetical protein [Bradyrhizobium diazoefficiens]MBR1014701.1 hypothetical protein [Bradyrhizobium diazoefficiens]MBR1052511.1 hypothetical protein [Bradyrhizobium diazoefficiens]
MLTSEITYEVYLRLNALSDADRERVRSAVAAVSKVVVSENPRYWSSLMAFDAGDKGAALAFANDQPVGFWVVERLHVGDVAGFYTVLTNVLPAYQGKHIAWELRTRFLPIETENDERPRFYTFLTRNPRSWQLNASLCKSAIPDIFDEDFDADLLELGKRAAKQLFPGNHLELPSMVISDVYPPLCCGAKEQHHRQSDIESTFFATPSLRRRENGRFFIGMLKSAAELRAMTGGHLSSRGASEMLRRA